MPQTRSQAKGDNDAAMSGKEDTSQAAGSKRKQPASNKSAEKVDKAGNQTKGGESEDAEAIEEPRAKATKQEGTEGVDQDKLVALLESHGSFPLSGYGLEQPEEPTAPTVLAHLFNAMLTSARISHELGTKSVKCMIEANYHDLETLKKSSWEERTEVLTKGGYTRYREKTATGLGELAELLSSKYDGDLNKLRESAGDDPHKVRELIKEIKGFGEVGTNIFQDTVQAVWPCMAPYVDPRSYDVAEELGLSKDVQALWRGVGEDAVKMAKLCTALTTVRLEKRVDDFKEEAGDGDTE